MLQSDYDMVSGQQFTVKVRKDPQQGGFVATVPSASHLGEFRAESQNRVIQKANDALAGYVANNYKK
ncbi:MAG: hypothetical protein ACO27L_08065 [Schleiferiaceae bacterium]